MKKFLIINILFATLLVGCDDWMDVNTDPNNPTEVGPDLVLPVAQHYTARYIQDNRAANHLGNMMMYNWSESAGFSWYNDEFLYLVTSTFYSRLFDQAYYDAMKNYSDLDDLGDEYGAYKAISAIMKAYHFQLLVDFYGDVPYTEALQRSGNATPVYDDAQAIYDDLIVQLTAAIEMLEEADADPVSVKPGIDDIMFDGDLDSWMAFANTVKLRILTRESDVKPAAYITTELAVIDAQGSGYVTSDVMVQPGYLNETDKQNPLWATFGQSVAGNNTLTNDATCATDYIISYLTGTGDPRISVLYEEPGTGHLGVPQGITSDPNTQGPSLVSNIGPGILIGATQGAKILTLAEVMFNQAELAQKGFGGDAATFYDAGVTASFTGLGLTAADATSYLSQGGNNIGFAGSTNPIEAIITQKWIAMNGITAEQSWFDWSRTGFPANLPVSIENPGLQRPVRLVYPASEVGGNAKNMPAQSNPTTAKIFWAN